jgi:hypothetical protein
LDDALERGRPIGSIGVVIVVLIMLLSAVPVFHKAALFVTRKQLLPISNNSGIEKRILIPILILPPTLESVGMIFVTPSGQTGDDRPTSDRDW